MNGSHNHSIATSKHPDLLNIDDGTNDDCKMDVRMKYLIALSAAITLSISSFLYAGNQSIYYPVETYPERVSSECRDGIAQIYDECSDQSKIVERAVHRANETGKTVLVVYGAEWCIWCHVFDKYVKGHSKKFKYEWQYHDGDNLDWKMREKENRNAKSEAKILNRYVSENFIIVHLESYRSPNGEQTAQDIGLNPDDFSYVPVIFSLDQSGYYAANMHAYNAIPGLEIREDSGRDFRGFDRNILLDELKQLRDISTR